jgi:hypothetical protein
MSLFFEFIDNLKQYRKRNLVYLLITIVVSVLISFITWWFQQQTINDLRFKLLTNQTNLQSQISEFEETTLTVPELQRVTLKVLERIENKLFISNFDYSYEKMSQSFLSEFCGVDSLSSETYIFQPMYEDYSLEPIFVFHNGSSKYLADCLISKNIRTVEIDTDLKIGISECYFSESETKDCMQFVRDVFNSDLN